MEQPCVLHRQRRLAGEGCHEIDHLSRKLTRLRARDSQSSHHLILPDERNSQQRAVAALNEQVAQTAVIGSLDRDVWNLYRLPPGYRLPGNAFPLTDRRASYDCVDIL